MGGIMTFYLLFFGLFIFAIFALSYRMDTEFKSNKSIFKRFIINKGLKRFFLNDNNEDGILLISYTFQILGYILIPISIVSSYIFAINDRIEDSDFYRYFGIAYHIGITILAIITIILYIIDRKER
jgi:hypothetical protein